ncbi:MAG: hypothetical protein IOB84_07870 [Brevundimonas sp.]|nr:hypothetical protein [Brevundimonas sp.]
MTDVTTTEESASDIVGGDGHGLLTLPDGSSVPARFHPLAQLLPMIEGAAYDELVADVKARGVQRPIVLFENQILDGRNRYMAARDAGVGYRTVAYTGNDPVGFVISENLHRRHLTTSQRSIVAARLADLPRGSNQHDERATPTAAQAAEMLSVSTRAVETARTVEREGAPELKAMVHAGHVSVSAAADVAALPPAEQAQVAEAGPAAVREAARRVREERQVERWRLRIAKLEEQADEDAAAQVGRVNTRLSIAVHLLAKGKVEEAAVIAERSGVSLAGLSAAHRMLTASPEDLQREQREIAVVFSAVMAAEVEVRTVKQIVDLDADERRVRAWRAGWASAVLGRPSPTEIGRNEDEETAFAEGFTAFSQRFESYRRAE